MHEVTTSLALQLAVITTALLAWHGRTGGDLEPWFGQSRPPNHEHVTARHQSPYVPASGPPATLAELM